MNTDTQTDTHTQTHAQTDRHDYSIVVVDNIGTQTFRVASVDRTDFILFFNLSSKNALETTFQVDLFWHDVLLSWQSAIKQLKLSVEQSKQVIFIYKLYDKGITRIKQYWKRGGIYSDFCHQATFVKDTFINDILTQGL